jgi:exopolyphosphatase / guanosine-5'-triphosphate,3'-diphosphate pyrophosphatase
LVRACIDIGSNTTRLLVAERNGAGRLREVCQQRAFTRIGRALKQDGAMAPEKVAEIAEVVALQAKLANEVGAQTLRAVATAAIRQAANREDLIEAIRARAGVEVHVLTDEEEARLAFVGATRTLTEPTTDTIAVVDVGGGSSEIAIGTLDGGMVWSTSMRIGSGLLADSYLRSDPPSVQELERARTHVAGSFEGLEMPEVQLGIAVGGSATSLRRLVGAVLEPDTLERGMRVLASAPRAEVARRFELDPERVKLLPAGIAILQEASDRLGLTLQIARGGLREGVILEADEAAEAG